MYRKQEPPTNEFWAMSFEQRKAIRQSQEQGKAEAREFVKIEEATARQAAIDATPPHLRRPGNIFTRLIAEWESKSYRPDVARKIKEYKRDEAQREKEIDAEMADKLRQHEVENNPETKPAREHWEKASAGAETADERREWARLKGLVEAGAASHYWDEVAPLMQSRLQTIQQRMDEQIGKQAAVVGKSKAMAAELEAANELQVKQETPKQEQVSE